MAELSRFQAALDFFLKHLYRTLDGNGGRSLACIAADRFRLFGGSAGCMPLCPHDVGTILWGHFRPLSSAVDPPRRSRGVWHSLPFYRYPHIFKKPIISRTHDDAIWAKMLIFCNKCIIIFDKLNEDMREKYLYKNNNTLIKFYEQYLKKEK